MKINKTNFQINKRFSVFFDLIIDSMFSLLLYILIVEGIFKWGHLKLSLTFFGIDFLFWSIVCFAISLELLDQSISEYNSEVTDAKGKYNFWKDKKRQMLNWLKDVFIKWAIIALISIIL